MAHGTTRRKTAPGKPVTAATATPTTGEETAGTKSSLFGAQHRFRGEQARRGMGWLRDLPDFRDTTLSPQSRRLELPHLSDARMVHGRVVKAIGKRLRASAPLPAKWDENEPFCSPVENQQSLGSCTANAGVGMIEYMENRAEDKYIDASRLFVYKVTRNLLGWQGDTGAYLRTTMKSLVLFGAPPEALWPYEDLTTFDNEPDAFLYAFAANYKALQYMRLDPPGLSGADVLERVKATLATKYLCMLGFPVYSSLGRAAEIPYPTPRDSLSGGHAVLAIGYDDSKQCPNAEKGALRIRNSWGTAWGDKGYGWLPYDYVREGLATDFWTCFKLVWVDTKKFD